MDRTEGGPDRAGKTSRRALLGSVLMGIGLVVSYGTLATQVLAFLLPRRVGRPTRRLFVGPVDRFEVGAVTSILDLEGNEVLVKRGPSGFQAFSSVCPHLGCRVRWEEDEQQFFCPCHRGFFNADGVATAGPPADAHQSLAAAPLTVDEVNGVVYLEVADPGRGKT